MLQFESACKEANIRFAVHRDSSIALQELKHESKFAALVIINENETFTNSKEPSPADFIKSLGGLNYKWGCNFTSRVINKY